MSSSHIEQFSDKLICNHVNGWALSPLPKSVTIQGRQPLNHYRILVLSPVSRVRTITTCAILVEIYQNYNLAYYQWPFVLSLCAGVKPYRCLHCDKSFTQRCSLESHCRKVHNTEYQYEYKQRRNKMYVCEECGFSTDEAETYYVHLRQNHPNCPVLAKPHDKRHFKFRNERAGITMRPRSEGEVKAEVRSEGKFHVERFLSLR